MLAGICSLAESIPHKTLSRGINLFNMFTASISQYVYLTHTNFVKLYFLDTLKNWEKNTKLDQRTCNAEGQAQIWI